MMESRLWHVMNVLSLSVDLAMSTREEKETNLVLSAKLVTSASKVTLVVVSIGLNISWFLKCVYVSRRSVIALRKSKGGRR